MSEAEPEPTPENSTSTRSLFQELVLFGNLLLGIGVIAFGCWRAFVWAFGPDESLFFAYRVEAKQAAEKASAQKLYDQGLRDLKRAKQTPEEQARERESLDRELAQTMAELLQHGREAYRVERWMELSVVAVSFIVGSSLGRQGWPLLA
jgi:hypothetical protein